MKTGEVAPMTGSRVVAARGGGEDEECLDGTCGPCGAHLVLVAPEVLPPAWTGWL